MRYGERRSRRRSCKTQLRRSWPRLSVRSNRQGVALWLSNPQSVACTLPLIPSGVISSWIRCLQRRYVLSHGHGLYLVFDRSWYDIPLSFFLSFFFPISFSTNIKILYRVGIYEGNSWYLSSSTRTTRGRSIAVGCLLGPKVMLS